MQFAKITWGINRLRCMSVAEVGYRVRTSVETRLQSRGWCLAKAAPAPRIVEGGRSWIDLHAQVKPAPYLSTADAVLRGELEVFALRPARIGHPPRWNVDPRTGTEAPRAFGKRLDYRDERLVGDIKYLWEPSRHLQLVTLAQAWHLSRDVRYLEGLKLQLVSWFGQCPYPMGVHWTSSLELGMRLINWSLVWHLTGGRDSALFSGEDGAEFRRRWLASIFQHQHFIAGYLSRYSSANNHLLGELAGLYVGAVTWPYWWRSSGWRRLARSLLISEGLKQNGEDGVNREQAISYQQYVFDQLLIPALAGRASGDEFPAAYWKRLEAMLEFLASMVDVAGNVPMIGDADDAHCIRLDPRPDFQRVRSSLTTGAILFQRSEFARKGLINAAPPDDQTVWLVGEAARRAAPLLALQPAQLPVRRAFPVGGYYLLGSRFETDEEIRLWVDAGPLGYEAIAAHGHADALSVLLSVGGREFLIDPGTYAYHTQAKWRDYFRGTSAHNTACIDGLDQSEPGGNFMWLRKARAVCERFEVGDERDVFVGSHDGYARLTDPVIHGRSVVLDHALREASVNDTFYGSEEHAVTLAWHWAEPCQVNQVSDKSVVAVNGPWRVILEIDSLSGELQLAVGNDAPASGWVSRRFDEKTPITSVCWSERGKGTWGISWRLRIHQLCRE